MRNFIFALIPLFITAPLSAASLDDIITWTLTNTPSGLAVSNKSIRAGFDHANSWLTLMPGLSLSGGAYLSGPDPFTNTWSLNLSLSKNFGDVDSTLTTLRRADLTLAAAYLDAEADRRGVIDRVILSYARLSLVAKEREVKERDLEQTILAERLAAVKYQNGREVGLTLQRLSNEVASKKLSLSESRLEEERLFLDYRLLTSLDTRDFPLDFPETPVGPESLLTNSDVYYRLLARAIGLSNSREGLMQKNRALYLPELSVSAGLGYNAVRGTASLDAGVGLSFSPLETWSRLNTIESTRLSLSDSAAAWTNDLRAFEFLCARLKTELSVLEERVKVLTDNLRITRELQKLYRYEYENDKIDYTEYRRRLDALVSEELSLLSAQSRLFIFKKRLQYGIAAL